MISAGLPIVRSLRSIARDHEDKKLSVVLGLVADDVEKGEALSAALAKHPGAYDDVFVSLVNTGEVSGTLDKIMEQTATYLERAETLRLKVQAALRYPIFVLSFALLILVAMVVKIIPMFAAIYERFRVPLPLPTGDDAAARHERSLSSAPAPRATKAASRFPIRLPLMGRRDPL